MSAKITNVPVNPTLHDPDMQMDDSQDVSAALKLPDAPEDAQGSQFSMLMIGLCIVCCVLLVIVIYLVMREPRVEDKVIRDAVRHPVQRPHPHAQPQYAPPQQYPPQPQYAPPPQQYAPPQQPARPTATVEEIADNHVADVNGQPQPVAPQQPIVGVPPAQSPAAVPTDTELLNEINSRIELDDQVQMENIKNE